MFREWKEGGGGGRDARCCLKMYARHFFTGSFQDHTRKVVSGRVCAANSWATKKREIRRRKQHSVGCRLISFRKLQMKGATLTHLKGAQGGSFQSFLDTQFMHKSSFAPLPNTNLQMHCILPAWRHQHSRNSAAGRPYALIQVQTWCVWYECFKLINLSQYLQCSCVSLFYSMWVKFPLGQVWCWGRPGLEAKG